MKNKLKDLVENDFPSSFIETTDSQSLIHPLRDKIFALVDCNSFFCSCERVFQPHLLNKPVIVLSSNDGCVIARTDEAKALGILMGVPYFQIKEFCKKNGVFVYSSNFALYGDMSRRIMKIISEHSPEIEIYSIDEAFLSLNGAAKEKLTSLALTIKEAVEQQTGVPVSIGIGSTKVLAKLANVLAKKNKQQTKGVVNLFDYENLDMVLNHFPVQNLWGIGRKSAEKLNLLQIKTAYDLKIYDGRVIQKTLSITGRQIQEELRGNACLTLEMVHNDKKQIISSRSFGQPVFKLEDLKESVANHITSAAERLRNQDCITSSILVFIQTSPFKAGPRYYNSTTINLATGSAVTNKLIKHAFAGLEGIYREGLAYKKVGVILMNIVKKHYTQLSFFEVHDSEREDLLMKTLDQINRREGKGALKFAACGTEQFWKTLSQMKSSQYSTRWSDLLWVK